MCVGSESSVINLIWTKKLVLLYKDYSLSGGEQQKMTSEFFLLIHSRNSDR
jgi:hypothetical protein